MFRLGARLVAEATYLIYTLAMTSTLSTTKELDPNHAWRDILRLSPFLSGYSGVQLLHATNRCDFPCAQSMTRSFIPTAIHDHRANSIWAPRILSYENPMAAMETSHERFLLETSSTENCAHFRYAQRNQEECGVEGERVFFQLKVMLATSSLDLAISNAIWHSNPFANVLLLTATSCPRIMIC